MLKTMKGTIYGCRFYSRIPPRKNNFYEVMGVPKNASQSEIKCAFYKLSKELHPDRLKDNSSHKRFVELNEAYQTLGNSTKRTDYDNSLRNPFYASANTSSHASYAGHDWRSSNWQQKGRILFQIYRICILLGLILLAFYKHIFASGKMKADSESYQRYREFYSRNRSHDDFYKQQKDWYEQFMRERPTYQARWSGYRLVMLGWIVALITIGLQIVQYWVFFGRHRTPEGSGQVQKRKSEIDALTRKYLSEHAVNSTVDIPEHGKHKFFHEMVPVFQEDSERARFNGQSDEKFETQPNDIR